MCLHGLFTSKLVFRCVQRPEWCSRQTMLPKMKWHRRLGNMMFVWRHSNCCCNIKATDERVSLAQRILSLASARTWIIDVSFLCKRNIWAHVVVSWVSESLAATGEEARYHCFHRVISSPMLTQPCIQPLNRPIVMQAPDPELLSLGFPGLPWLSRQNENFPQFHVPHSRTIGDVTYCLTLKRKICNSLDELERIYLLPYPISIHNFST